MCRDGDLNRVQVRVELNRNLVNDFDLMGYTGLHWAAKRGHLDIAKILLEHGADPDAEDMVRYCLGDIWMNMLSSVKERR